MHAAVDEQPSPVAAGGPDDQNLPAPGFHPEWHLLQLRVAEDPRIHLYGCCDVFLSLHRSEGFGRGIAEALQLGVDVIATAYAGNTDFCADAAGGGAAVDSGRRSQGGGARRGRLRPRRNTDALSLDTGVLLTWLRDERCQEAGLENGSLVLWPVPKCARFDRAAAAGGGCCRRLCGALAWAGFSW